MGIERVFQDIGRTLDRPAADPDRVKGRWFGLKDGESAKIKFLQEIDADSPNYDPEKGQSFLAVEHANPDSFMKKALCSFDDQGRCFGCEMHRRDMKAGWNGKTRFYSNVLVDDGKAEPFVAILSQGAGPKAITPTLMEYAAETGSITNVVWKIKRTGSGNTDTSYSIIPLPPTAVLDLPADAELFDLEKSAVKDIAYADQEAFYLGAGYSGTSQESAPVSNTEEW